MKARFHLTKPLASYAVLLTIVVLVAMHTQYNFLFWLMGLMFGLLVVSMTLTWLMIRASDVHRADPAYGAVGTPLTVRYILRNRARRLPLLNMHVIERPARRTPQGRPWQDLVPALRAWVMHVPPGETTHAETVVWPDKRGVMRFESCVVRTSTPLGIIARSRRIGQPQETLVFPRLFHLRQDLLRMTNSAYPMGMRMSQRAGAGDEYFGVREYRAGDSRRSISWKLSARRDELVCIERTQPSPPKLRVVLALQTPTDALVVDASGPSSRDLEEDAISLAGSLVRAAHEDDMEVGLTIVGLGEKAIPVRHNTWHLGRMLAALARIDLDASRTMPTGNVVPEAERAGVIVVHPGRIDPSIGPEDAAHLTARRLDELTSGALGWDPSRVRTRPGADADVRGPRAEETAA